MILGSTGTYAYTWGAGYNGQLGRKIARGQAKYSSKPVFVALGKPVNIVSCGSMHSIILTGISQRLDFGGSFRFVSFGIVDNLTLDTLS